MGEDDKNIPGADAPEVRGELKSQEIARVRDRINAVDAELLRLIAERRGLSRQMAEAKEEGSMPIRDKTREEALLVDRVRIGRTYGLDATLVTAVLNEIIADSVRLQQSILQRRANPEYGQPSVVRVAIQGVEGAYSHLAAKKFFGRQQADVVLLECDTFDDVAEAVESGRADYGMLPVENTTSGGINPVYDTLLHARVSIVGEEKFKVEHCLAVKPGVELRDVREAYSHPQALAQCGAFMKRHPRIEPVPYMDTAAAVKMVATSPRMDIAAIASEEAARLHGLRVLEHDIASQKENYTRFLIVARNPRRVDPRIPSKTSLVMATSQRPGALMDALSVFRDRGLNLTKLESRPILGNPWEEMFYVDVQGNIDDEHVASALEALSQSTRFLKVLGSYPSEDLLPVEISPKSRLDILGEAHATQGEKTVSAPVFPSLDQREIDNMRRVLRISHPQDTVLDVQGVKFGGDHFAVIAGPAFIRSRDQIDACARAVRDYGGNLLRAGARYIPAEGNIPDEPGVNPVDVLHEVGQRYGLPIVTNVNNPDDVKYVADNVDLLMISARNMMNRSLLEAVGRSHRPVLLKRGWMASIEELLQAANTILEQGNQQVILCERGIRTFETSTRNTLDLTAIPLLRQLTHLPIVVDPSRAAGRADLVAPLALAAKAAGAHGVMVETDIEDTLTAPSEPEKRELAQALSFEQFESLMRKLVD